MTGRTGRAVVFETERLVVRDWRDQDAPRMFDMYSRADVVRFLGSVPTPMPSVEAAHDRIARGVRRNAEQAGRTPCGWWAVEVRDTGQVAGTVALVPVDGSTGLDAPVEVAWHLHPDAQGHGYATEAARGALDRAHEAGLAEVLALTDEANTASQAVCRRLGLELQGVSEEFYGKPLMVWVSRAASAGGATVAEKDTAATADFRATLEAHGKTATGFAVPPDVVGSLGAGKRPPVRVTIGAHTYRSTVAVMGGRFMLGVSAENRAAAGVAAGDALDVHLELDTAPREVTVPPDLARALAGDEKARTFFDSLSPSQKQWHTQSVESAKTDETRARRVAKSVEMLREGRKR
jgi:RimJ/RimL family protein N-acetyltransferase